VRTENIANHPLVRAIFFCVYLAINFSCHSNERGEVNASIKPDTVKSPVTITGMPPVVTLLDTCPPPRTITIPAKKQDSFVIKINNSKTVIRPPETKPADFMVLMQNYNTDQGLAYSAVSSSCVDKSGNLWFGTFGGGVSRYDGKAFMNYTTTLGLANNHVTSILEDKGGNLWFGTIGGASRYTAGSSQVLRLHRGVSRIKEG
jgi:hypothetical protein